MRIVPIVDFTLYISSNKFFDTVAKVGFEAGLT